MIEESSPDSKRVCIGPKRPPKKWQHKVKELMNNLGFRTGRVPPVVFDSANKAQMLGSQRCLGVCVHDVCTHAVAILA